MDELDQLFKSHKEAFDRLEPRSNSWTTIKEAVDKGNESDVEKHIHRPVHRRSLLKLAAALVLLLGVTSVWLLNWRGQQAKFDQIVLHSPQGEPVRLDPAQNKFTLVQFWASGNAICTEENCYYYLPAYEKYKDHGFEIYAISVDEDINAWVNGIEENHLPWIHVSDLKGWDSPVCIECNITKVPSNFLLNHKGKIIARDLDAKDLEITLDRLLALQ
ncbi:MAG: TlpA family protein disulfide reductase [Saprospiraceae bacterium]|nr:TlpA family protein disulfide reductase [Saprospiraceae bacterium]MCB9326266.1 TlpA family protein disulfide reductase [Lewinellaceae bacterium]